MCVWLVVCVGVCMYGMSMLSVCMYGVCVACVCVVCVCGLVVVACACVCMRMYVRAYIFAYTPLMHACALYANFAEALHSMYLYLILHCMSNPRHTLA